MAADPEKVEYILACEALAVLGHSGAGVLAEMMRVERYEAGDVVTDIGEEAACVYLIAEGQVSVFPSGAENEIRKMGPGELLGEYGMFSSAKRTSTVTAVESCMLLSVDYPRFQKFMHQFPDLMYQLLQTAVRRLTELEAEVAGRA